MDEEHCALYIVIVSDRLYVLGGEAGSYRERGAYQDQDQDQDDDDDDDEQQHVGMQ